MDEATFFRLADEVEVFWGVHLYPRLVEDARTPRTDWYYVSVPRDLLAEDRDSVLTVLLHEWGHHTISPRTVRQMLFWQGIALGEGLGDSGEFLNTVADVWVDNWYLRGGRRGEGEWGEVYERGMTRHLELLADQLLAQFAEGRGDTIEVQRLAVLFDLESLALCTRWGTRHDPVLPITRDAWQVLTDERTSETDRIRKVARMLNYLYPRTSDGRRAASAIPAGLWGTRLVANPAGEPVEPLLRAWQREQVDVDARDMIDLLGPDRGRVAFENRELNRIYAEVSRLLPRAAGPGASGPAEPAGSAVWRWGQPPRELDWVGTLSAFGFSVPGVTTLRRRWRAGGIESGEVARRTICLVADDSGSTWGSVNARVVEAAVGLVEAARRWRDRVSLVIFGDAVVDAWPPCSDYAPLERRLVRMAGLSGGTLLGPALEKAHDLCRAEAAVTTCVITDTDAADAGTPEVGDAFARLVRRGPVLVFDVGGRPEERARPGWCALPGVSIYEVSLGRPLADQVIRGISQVRGRASRGGAHAYAADARARMRGGEMILHE